MALPKTLTSLCVDGVYDYTKTIISHISKSGKKEKLRLLAALYRVITIFKSWNLRNVFDRSKYKNHDIKWKIRIEDLKHNSDYTTASLYLQSSAELERFEAFLRHLISNWCQDVKVERLSNGFLKYVVTHPVPVLLHFYPQYQTDCEDLRFSNSPDVRRVTEVITSLLANDFCLSLTTNETEKLSYNKPAESQNPDCPISHFVNACEIDLFTNHLDYASAEPDSLQNELEKAYFLASNVHQYPVLERDSFTSSLIPSERSRHENPQVEQNLLSHASESSQTTATSVSSTETQTDFNYEKLFESIEAQRMLLQLQIDELTNETKRMAEIIKKKELEMSETLLELGRVSVELTRVENEKKRDELFKKTYKSHTTSTQTSEILKVSTMTAGAGLPSWSNEASSTMTENGNHLVGHDESFPISIQESLSEIESLTDIPTTSGVERNIYNNYKLLLLKLGSGLLEDDVDKLKQWAENEFQIHTSRDVNTIFKELDRKKAINITDLSRLKKFFEDNFRFDLVHLIDSYLLGEYEQLKYFKTTARLQSFNAQSRLTDLQSSTAHKPSNTSEIGHTSRVTQGPTGSLLGTVPVHQRGFPGISRSNFSETQNGRTPGISTKSFIPGAFEGSSSGRGKEAVRNVGSSESQGMVVLDGGADGNEAESSARSTRARRDRANTARNTDGGTNGQKLSKFSRPDSTDDDLDINWLCSHYKRRCYVKFECCNKFWPCHRCHNNQSSCGRKKLKSRDTIRIKCAACGQEQQFAHYCSRCNAKFARYFCALCKHLTGTDDNPYHCDKCGICRIHGDRSFHCDVCGVCLDVQLRGNHKCREGSAHDECCICLEDAFTGCQILPCSHKVHKECATQMIRSGIRRCPICRESFAHKLERKPPPFKKPPGKE